MLNGNELQDVLGQYSRSALMIFYWHGKFPRDGGNLERLVAGFAESELYPATAASCANVVMVGFPFGDNAR